MRKYSILFIAFILAVVAQASPQWSPKNNQFTSNVPVKVPEIKVTGTLAFSSTSTVITFPYLSGTTLQTGTLTLPPAGSDVLVSNTTAATLQHKTLASPVITGSTSIGGVTYLSGSGSPIGSNLTSSVPSVFWSLTATSGSQAATEYTLASGSNNWRPVTTGTGP